MFQFPGFASYTYVFSARYHTCGGFPHSDIRGSKVVRTSPRLFAAYHVLHRLLVPRHPTDALLRLIYSMINIIYCHTQDCSLNFLEFSLYYLDYSKQYVYV